ncbi:cysteine synthase A [Saccharicrinis sp. FJH54]|uniref:cysteine synthase A n=1 Tax=Saccharicrinis sp. FJH54 TaxID=3344665 RepID=UPI0035D48338
MIYNNITETIGNTPLIKLNKIVPEDVNVLVKLESFNPGSSVKDRIALSMIEKAEKDGQLDKDTVIIEPTSGNTGIGLALVSAAKGYRLILTMPESMSIERRKILKALGAELELTPKEGGMKGAISRAFELAEKYDKTFIPQQFKNKANPEIHRLSTAREIWEDTKGEVDVFVAGIGTGGTITGVGEVLKNKRNSVKIVAVEPEKSPVLSGGEPGPHKIQGIGAGFIPDILNTEIYDEIVRIKEESAIEAARKLGVNEGILVGISSGGALAAGLEIASRPESKGKTIVILLPDTGERYLSTALFDYEQSEVNYRVTI